MPLEKNKVDWWSGKKTAILDEERKKATDLFMETIVCEKEFPSFKILI